MSTPEEQPPIEIGAIWYAVEQLGVGAGAVPKDSEVEITDYLEPYSPGVGYTDEMTVRGKNVGTYGYYDSQGVWRESQSQRYLAYPESEWRVYFALKLTAEEAAQRTEGGT